MGGVVVLGGCCQHLSGARCFFDWVDFTSTGGKWGYGGGGMVRSGFGGVAQVLAELYSRPLIVSKSKGIQLAAECLLSSCCSDIKERSQ